METAAQTFGILAFIVSVISFQLTTYRRILMAQTLCAALFVIHFLLLARCGQADAVTGAALNGVCAVRDVILLASEKKRTQKQTVFLAACFSAAVVTIGIITWSSPVSLLFIIAMVLNTVALSIPDPNIVRVFIMMSAPFACAYDVLTHSIGGTVNEAVSFLSALTAYIRCRRKNREAPDRAAAEDSTNDEGRSYTHGKPDQ